MITKGIICGIKIPQLTKNDTVYIEDDLLLMLIRLLLKKMTRRKTKNGKGKPKMAKENEHDMYVIYFYLD